ncbi:GAF domain-containing sensor histidine kinase [Paenibacillus xanthanilyticus]|uniref:histidine kinase n=1 Tax=Paenibacillus xanthanilyticus TaxID=1783531 RepID=A0ABV8K7X5_9BACL
MSSLIPSVRSPLEDRSSGFLLVDHHYRIRNADSIALYLLEISNFVSASNQVLPDWMIEIIYKSQENFTRSSDNSFFQDVIYSPSQLWIELNVFIEKEVIFIYMKNLTPEKEVGSKIQKNHEQLLLLAEAANHIIFNEEPKQMLDALFADLSNYLELDVYFNYIYDPNADKLSLMNYAGIDSKTAESIKWLEFGEAVCGTVAQVRTKMIVENIQQSEDPRVQLIKGFGIQTYACHPLLSYGRLIGTLSFGSSTRSTFSRTELELMETISNQCAMAFERVFLITKLKATNQKLLANYDKLRYSENKFTEIFNAAHDGIIVLDADSNIIEANPSAYYMLGLDPSYLISKNVFDYCEIINLDKNIREVTLLVWNGLKKIFEYSVTNKGTSGEQIIIFRDITLKRKTALELIEAKEQAEQASKAKTDFLSMMSHELRTPLHSILGYSQMMIDDEIHQLNGIQLERATKLLKSARHLMELINEIIDHAQTESGPNLMLTDINLSEVIEDTIKLIEPMSKDKNITIENRIKPSCIVIGDLIRVRQILTNLLSNAIKYNYNNGRITIRSTLEEKKNQIKISIEDTGIGIPQNNFHDIFEPFFRIYDPLHNIEGTGIGLTIARNYVSLMGGEIGVDSKQNQGSKFWFTLPSSQNK